METILCLVHVETDGTLAKASLEAVNSAATLAKSLPGSAFAVGLIGELVQAAANAIATCGAAKFYAVSGADFASPRYATDAAAAEAICRAANATLIIASGGSRWARVGAGVAQRLKGRADTHVTAISVENGAPRISRWYYRQRIETILSRAQRPWLILTDPGSAAAWSGATGTATVESVKVAITDANRRTTVTGIRAPAADAQTIRPEAEVLFVAGAGWTKKQANGQPRLKEAETLILDFLKQSRASLGSSKSLVDISGEGQAVLSFLTHLNQIGQTGSTPRHAKGLATCCHGEEPHSVGWRFINERRAINLDANCGWARGKADILYVADAFAVMAKVNALLATR
jgi:electron transfer flavoprotein alpha subunit